MKHPTQSDVAKRVGVSRATVSYVLNGPTSARVLVSEETRQRVLAAIEELGYEPDARAQALRSGNTKTIALIIPDLRNPHFGEYAVGIEQEARAAGYHLLLYSTSLDKDYAVEIFRDLTRRRIDGLIMATSFIIESAEAQATFAQIRARGFPAVVLGYLDGVDSVTTDYREATKSVVSFLLSLQHRRIGLVYGVGGHELAEDRLEPYRASLNAADIPIDDDLIIKCGPTIEDDYQASRSLLKRPSRPTAIITINDLLAIGALRAATDLGLRVPDDLSLIGFDDIPMANYLVPRLTSVTNDAVTLGRKAFALLMSRIQEPDVLRQRIESTVRLIVRESTGRAPRGSDNDKS